MKFNLLLAVLGLLVSAAVDWYLFKRLSVTRSTLRKPGSLLLLASVVVQYAAIIAAVAIPVGSASDSEFIFLMWLIFIFLSLFLSKTVLLVVDVLARLYRCLRKHTAGRIPLIAWCLSGLVFLALWWGALINRNRISVVECELSLSGLPAGFDGYRVVQISDFHVGTWGGDTAFVSKVVDKINDLDPDLIVFTGDIVNRSSRELEPMILPLTRLRAKDGLYAITGNHDYGDYIVWESDSAHFADRINLRSLYERTPFRLLDNTSEYIYRNGDSIAVIGVENIAEPPFATYGDLDATYEDLSDSVFKILLSHNPRHWTSDIKDDPSKNIALTLSGHTHAMQIQIAGHSPASFKYPTDWGLFSDSIDRYLYVNRGLGTVGFPMRLGATPEITLFKFSSR